MAFSARAGRSSYLLNRDRYAGRVDKRYAARGERLPPPVAVTTIQVYIQQGEVEGLRINQARPYRSSRQMSPTCIQGRPAGLHHHKNQHLILDNEDPPTGKQLIHREDLGGKGMSIVQTRPSVL